MKIVLIWASNNPEKFWNKILKDIVSKWHNVIPINPKETEIEWIKTYKNIGEIHSDFDIVNFVVKPEITNLILEKNLKILQNKKIWIQPWASNEETKDFLKNNWFKNYIIDSCIIVEKIN